MSDPVSPADIQGSVTCRIKTQMKHNTLLTSTNIFITVSQHITATQHTAYSNIKMLSSKLEQHCDICIYILVKRDRSVFNFIFLSVYYFAIPVYIVSILDKVLCI